MPSADDGDGDENNTIAASLNVSFIPDTLH